MRTTIFVMGMAALVGCGNPGEHLGTLTVQATLAENTCGSGVGDIPTTSEISVDLYERDGILTWVGSGGTFQATIDDDGSFLFTASGQQMLRAEEPGVWGVRAACVVDVYEEIRGTLVRPVRPDDTAADAGTEPDETDPVEPVPASVEATDTLTVSPTSGSDCSDQIGAASGLFQALPCRVLLELSGQEEE